MLVTAARVVGLADDVASDETVWTSEVPDAGDVIDWSCPTEDVCVTTWNSGVAENVAGELELVLEIEMLVLGSLSNGKCSTNGWAPA